VWAGVRIIAAAYHRDRLARGPLVWATATLHGSDSATKSGVRCRVISRWRARCVPICRGIVVLELKAKLCGMRIFTHV